MCCNRRRRCCRICTLACCPYSSNNQPQPQPRSGICTINGTVRYTDVPMTTVNGLSDGTGYGCGCNGSSGVETAIPWNGRCR